jgi:hypothetical protein
MKGFWICIIATLVAVFIGLSYLPNYRPFQVSVSVQLARYALLSILVGVIWAICFRREVEQFRFSLWAIFALAAMEAVLLGAIRIVELN